ncbi:MAG: 16S rRNA (cytidine(1402)-2'-O)-methyltransferase [Defluviitaleaceae bacterium]|nr:16S rRNA (cytidine(1402)-2'-O)-methyltransferase [Defluviitaleaceae bacterium]
MSGTLFIVATPIGNLEDISARALRVLGEVDLIAAEDTRHSRTLLAHFSIKKPVFSCHKFNEGKRGDFFVSEMLAGKNIALISDAGTPCISDPGSRLVKAAADASVTIVPICGASAVTSALSVSGFDASRFIFLGFLPRGKAAATAIFDASAASDVIIFYESPKRIMRVLELIEKNFPTAQICLCNDISKKFEKIYRGAAADVLEELRQNPAAEKGEYTCVLRAPSPQSPIAQDAPSLESRLVEIMAKKSCTLKEASTILFDTQSNEKARTARIEHRGHMSKATHSLEAGSNFLDHEKARQARIEHRGHVSESAHSLEAGRSFLDHEKIPKKEIYAAMLRLKEMFSHAP